MLALDKKTSESFGIPSRVLMETAGKGCADYLHSTCRKYMHARVAIFCGRGNNGGDGYVIARWLYSYGYQISVYYLETPCTTEEAEVNRQLCIKLGINMIDLSTESEWQRLMEASTHFSMLIDAVYGIGFKGEMNPRIAKLFEHLNALAAFRVAIDIPSGVCANSSNVRSAFCADLCLAIEALKFGHIIGEGREYAKAHAVIPIGIPKRYYEELAAAILTDKQNYSYPHRCQLYNKSHYGHVFIFAGSQLYSGAALLSARAALRSGAGYVHLMQRPEMKGFYNARIPEVICHDIPAADDEPDCGRLAQLLSPASVILFGPGFGKDPFAQLCLKFLLCEMKEPMVIDADGLAILATSRELLSSLAEQPILLTPHVGEFLALCTASKEDYLCDPISHITAFQKRYGTKLLVKNHCSIYAGEDGMFLSNSGNDGLATGGSGDVLAGIIASFIAQKMDIGSAAINASYLLGKTAEGLAKVKNTPAICPSDIIDKLFEKENEDDL